MIYIAMLTIGALVTVATATITESILTRQDQHEVDGLELMENEWRQK